MCNYNFEPGMNYNHIDRQFSYLQVKGTGKEPAKRGISSQYNLFLSDLDKIFTKLLYCHFLAFDQKVEHLYD